MNMKLIQRSQLLWEKIDPSKEENYKYFLESVFSNMKDAAQIYTRMYYAILVLMTVYWLLNSGNFQEFKVFDLNIKDIDTLMWVIPTLISYLYYQGMTALIFENSCQRVIDQFLSKHSSAIYTADLESLVYPPTFMNLERNLARMVQQGRNITIGFGALLIFIVTFLPVIATVFFIINNFVRLGYFPTDPIKVAAFVIAALVLLRVLLITTFTLSETY